MNVVEFAPHAGLSSNDVDTLVSRAKFIDISPSDVGLVGSTISVSKSYIKISEVIVGKNNLVGSTNEVTEMRSKSPPLQHVIFF